MKLSVTLFAIAVLIIPAALAVGGFNGLSLIGTLCAVGAIVAAFVHELRTAPLEPGEYSRLDILDGLGRLEDQDAHDARMRSEARV